MRLIKYYEIMLQLSQNGSDYLIVRIGSISTSLPHTGLSFHTIATRQRLSVQLMTLKLITGHMITGMY